MITLSAAQIKASGIQTEKAGAATGGPSAALRLQGTVVWPPQAMETVSAPVAGFVRTVLVSPSDVLRAGQAVAKLHSTQLMEWQRDYIQLDVQATQAQDRLQRSERLAAEGIVAESRVREDRYAYTQAKIAAQERQQALRLSGMGDARVKSLRDKPAVQAELNVSAPRPGTVVEVLTSPGQRVEAGAPLITLARSGVLALALQATPDQSAALHTGATVKVIGLIGCAATGRVRGVAANLRGGNQAVTVHVDLLPMSASASGAITAPCLRANQSVEAEVNVLTPTAASVSVPTRALVQHAAQDHVFVQDGQGFRATPVQVLARGAERSSLTGLKPGATIATQGLATLKGAWLGLGEEAGKP